LIGQIFVEADLPVAHDVEAAKVELDGQQTLGGRPGGEIFDRENIPTKPA